MRQHAALGMTVRGCCRTEHSPFMAAVVGSGGGRRGARAAGDGTPEHRRICRSFARSLANIADIGELRGRLVAAAAATARV